MARAGYGDAAWRETSRFVQFVMGEEADHTLRTLLTAEYSFPEAALNDMYGLRHPATTTAAYRCVCPVDNVPAC